MQLKLSQASNGSLSLTTHLIVNGEIITQAPALKNATLLTYPPDPGSWKTVATVLGTILLSSGVASKDSVLGHLLTSAYDYVISESLGFHVDFDKSLGQMIEDHRRQSDQVPRELDEGKFASLIEKIERAIVDLHRPIAYSGTANTARIGESTRGTITRQTGPLLDIETFDYINVTKLTDLVEHYVGRTSSYNSNTFKGRVYLESEGRPVPFTLSDSAKRPNDVSKIVMSLAANAMDRFDVSADIEFDALRYESKNGRLKGLLISHIY